MSQPPIRLVYVVSVSYSGSTLLDLLLSSHPEIASIGEAKGFATGSHECTCEAGTAWNCPWWARVDEALRSTAGVPLRDLRIDAEDDGEFAANNRALLEAVRLVTGNHVIVDSSKDVRRLRRLIGTSAVEVLPIHLIRSPEGVAYSNLKRGLSWAVAAYAYGRRLTETGGVLAGNAHRLVRYEALTADPERVLRGLMTWIGVPFEPQQLEWAGRERHNLGGNPMRRTKNSAIRPDVAWREAFGPWRRAAVGALVLVGRISPFRPPQGWHFGGSRRPRLA